MSRARAIAAAGLLIASLCSSRALADDPRTWLDAAMQHDLDGKEPASVAFALYLRAAEAGLPEAEFNVGVMLDSGRGVEKNLASAATWYARAAARDNRRAAYNLGQLYELGEGVPKNLDLARAWFVASDLVAARAHLKSIGTDTLHAASLSAPNLVAPNGRAKISVDTRTIELVWTAQAQAEPTDFFFELRQFDPSGSHEVLSGYTTTSSTTAALPDPSGHYAWRVLALARRAGQYTASDWLRFDVDSTDQQASSLSDLGR